MSWARSFLGQSGCTKRSWCLLRPAGSGDRRRGPYASGDCPAFPPTMLSSTSWWPCGFGGQSLSEFQWASRNPPKIHVVCSLPSCHIPSSSHFWARNAGEVLNVGSGHAPCYSSWARILLRKVKTRHWFGRIAASGPQSLSCPLGSPKAQLVRGWPAQDVSSCVPPPQPFVRCHYPAGQIYIKDMIVLQIWVMIQLPLHLEAGISDVSVWYVVGAYCMPGTVAGLGNTSHNSRRGPCLRGTAVLVSCLRELLEPSSFEGRFRAPSSWNLLWSFHSVPLLLSLPQDLYSLTLCVIFWPNSYVVLESTIWWTPWVKEGFIPLCSVAGKGLALDPSTVNGWETSPAVASTDSCWELELKTA